MFRILLVLALLVGVSSASRADFVWEEVGDAGGTTATAQSVAGTGLLTAITGRLSPNTSELDYFRFYYNGTGALVITSPSSVASGSLYPSFVPPPTLFDPALRLFTSTGTLLQENDDIAGLTAEINYTGAAGFYIVRPFTFASPTDSGRTYLMVFSPNVSEGPPVDPVVPAPPAVLLGVVGFAALAIRRRLSRV
jgi:hypothetical protein